jgi:phosphohistidine phosphatase SixA
MRWVLSIRHGSLRLATTPCLAVACLLAFAACGNDDAGDSAGTPVAAFVQLERPSDADLVAALRNGGLVIYIRHAATDQQQADNDGPELADCGLQRNLDLAGREQAATIGAAIEDIGVPIGDVQSSRYCRCQDTARIAFGHVTVNDDLTGYLAHTTPDEKVRRLDALATLLATAPAEGNTVLVAHQFNLEDLVGLLLEEGEAAIFRPGEDGSIQLLAQLKVSDWTALRTPESND